MNEFTSTDMEGGFEWADTLHKWIFRGKILLKKYWWIFILTVSLGIFWQAWQEYDREPLYVSNAKMIVSGRITLPEGGAYREELANFFGTQIALMKSSIVQKNAQSRVAVLRPELKATAVSLNASQQPDTSMFNLGARGLEPEYTQAYLDACLEEYINLRKKMRTETSDKTLLDISERLLRLEDKIEEEENQVVDFQKKNNLVFIQEQGSNAGTYLSQLKKRMADLRTSRRLVENFANKQRIDDGVAEMEEILRIDVLDLGEDYQVTGKRLDKITAERDEFSIYLKPRHPKMIAFNQEIQRFDNMLEIYRKQAMKQLLRQKDSLHSQISNLETVIEEWEQTALQNSRLLAEYERFQSRLKRSRNRYDQLLSAIQSIEVSQGVQQESLEILEHASPSYQVKADIAKKVSQGGIAGLALGIGLIILLGMVDNRVMSADDISQRFEQPVMGVIPLQKRGKDGKMEFLKQKDERHYFAEACRTLRSSLLFMENEGTPPKVIIVTSAIPTEGKSTVSGNLAITLAYASSKILLVDADLRRGRLAKDMDMTIDPGLSEYIQGKSDLESIIQKTETENLEFISCGNYPERPGELLLSQKMEDLLVTLRERYDYVIFDTAPILATDDTTSFAANADAVLFTVRSAYTQLRQVKESVERLRLRRANLCGFVLNFVDTKGSDYYYYSKYHNYYAYSPQSGNRSS